ncbi:hypothetical protein E2C01_014870 [Portunus trituberculatus]|uniref:Uncharacterized protein n=1 Tax=Portunus trituberculatus TaxID=210409 RepID=A0A5B7DL80_PORTR|nr:hypothetical protein [Portunus trituberculatus]
MFYPPSVPPYQVPSLHLFSALCVPARDGAGLGIHSLHFSSFVFSKISRFTGASLTAQETADLLLTHSHHKSLLLVRLAGCCPVAPRHGRPLGEV